MYESNVDNGEKMKYNSNYLRDGYFGLQAMSWLPSLIKIWVRKRKRLFRHDDVIKWKHFPRYWPFVRGIHRSPVNSPHKGQWRGALMFSLMCARINSWVNNREAGDLRRYRHHYDGIVMAIALHHNCMLLLRLQSTIAFLHSYRNNWIDSMTQLCWYITH